MPKATAKCAWLFFYARPTKIQKESAPHSSPDPSCGAETKFKNPFLKK
jgi:hypothetical protein